MDSNGDFSLTIRGVSGSGVVNGTPAVIANIDYAVSGVDNLDEPTTATVTASGGDCDPIAVIAVFTPGRCPVEAS